MYKEDPIRLSADFSNETAGQRDRQETFKVHMEHFPETTQPDLQMAHRLNNKTNLNKFLKN